MDKKYVIQPGDEVVVDGDKKLAVKAPWEELKDAPGNFVTWAVEEGAQIAEDGSEMYPAVRIEGRRGADGSWFVNGNFGNEEEGELGELVREWWWSQKDGLVSFE